MGVWWESISGYSWSQVDMITTWRYGIYGTCPVFTADEIWVIYINNVLSNKTILFDILDFWCQLVVIRFVKTLSKRHMCVSSMKISACWLLHRWIIFNKICWEKRPAKSRPNLWTSFCRRDLKNTQPHLKIERHPVRSCWAQRQFEKIWLRERLPAPKLGIWWGDPLTNQGCGDRQRDGANFWNSFVRSHTFYF